MSFTTNKEHLEEAYWLALNVFDIAFREQAFTNISPDPWTATSAISLKSQQGDSYEYLVQVSIRELEDLGKYSFTFARLKGDALKFQTVWLQIEGLFLAMISADGKHLVFKDYVEDVDSDEDLEEEEKNAEKDEVETKRVFAEADDAEAKKVVTVEAAEHE